jgi:hypothetical protein
MIPREATLLDAGTRPGYGDEPGVVNYAVWFVDMIGYKGEPSVILQVTTDKGAEKGCGVILTRSMLQSMLSDIITRQGSSIPVRT